MLQHETSPQTAPLRSVFQQDVSLSEDALTSAPTQTGTGSGEQTQNPPAVTLTAQEFARAAVEAETQPLSGRASRRAARLSEQQPRTTFTDNEGNVFAIDATSQELLAEVQAYRTVKHRNIAMSPFRRKDLSWWLLLGGFIASSAAALGITFLLFRFVRSYNVLTMDYVKQQQKLATVEQMQRNTSALRPLSQIADNKTVYARYTDLIALANGTSPDQIYVANTLGNASPGSPQWMLLRSHGSYVVRGWRWPEDYTIKYKDHQNNFSSIGWQYPATLPLSDVPITSFHNQVLLPITADSSAGTGEVIEMPDTL